MDAMNINFILVTIMIVSIHAPVMDAIAQYGQVTPPPKVSIHAPVMDAIRIRIPTAFLNLFQSTRP